jgi:hypothetical protein
MNLNTNHEGKQLFPDFKFMPLHRLKPFAISFFKKNTELTTP